MAGFEELHEISENFFDDSKNGIPQTCDSGIRKPGKKNLMFQINQAGLRIWNS